MRIARLDLTRYGRFSDYPIDFGSAPANGSDFHVVYGLNEAGKSTAAAAILDLLFGIDDRSPYGAAKGRASVPNWHAYSTMRIGARLELSGGAYEIARLKRDKNSLVDADDRPFDENVLKAELAGVDRAGFRMMFSLDDESLEKGGEAILESRGDLGQLLFSASAGLAEMSGRLDGLRDKADQFFRPRAKITELAEKKRALEFLKEERDKADTLASTYAELMRQRDEAKSAYEASAKALAERRTRAEGIQRLLAGLPHLAALRDAEARLAPLADLPRPPDGWRERLAELEAEAIRLAAQKESAETAIRALERELEQIRADAPALRIAERVEGWRELRSRYDAAKDIPVRRGEREGKRDTVAEILSRLGRAGEADPAGLLLSTHIVGALEDLVAERSGVATRLEAARTALDDAKTALADAEDQAPQSERGGATIEVLKLRLQASRRDESAQRVRAIRDEMEKQARKLQAVLAGLGPWRGDPEALAYVSVPTEAETSALRQRLSQAVAARQNHAGRLADKTREAQRLKAEAAAAARATDLVGDSAASQLRAAREAAWSAHRAALSAATADVFEAALRRDDAAGAARLANARELAAGRERAVKLAGVEAERALAKADLDAAEQALDALDHEIAALMPAPPPTGRDALGFLDAWRVRRDEAMAIVATIVEAKDAARRANDDAMRVREALSVSLRTAGIRLAEDSPIWALVETGEAAIAEEARFESQRQKTKERQAEVARAASRLKAALDDDARWGSAWRKACASSWLGEAGAEPPLNAVRQTLKALDELRAALKDCAELDHRIGAMERDKELFAAEVAEIGEALDIEGRDGDAARLAETIEARVARAREDERRRQEKIRALEAARESLAKIVKALAVNAKLASAMTEFFRVGTLSEVAVKLDECRRRDDLRHDIARETRAIHALNVASSLDAARAALEAADREALEGEFSALKTREGEDVAANAEGFAAYREALRRLDAVGGDDAVARIEEKRRTILEEIKDGARRYLTLRAGLAAADAALKLYRDRHRGAMMERASKAFSEISRGAYRGLTAQPNGQSETLIALGSDGGSKAAEQLSKGARFQLYLALRVAGYHELAKSRAPAPFIADDIMETFDHFRAEEALRLFADMGRVGQVIYLTHHLHLAEIAKRVCPEARVHELAA
jgi:uncharacterized protein YhaN